MLLCQPALPSAAASGTGGGKRRGSLVPGVYMRQEFGQIRVITSADKRVLREPFPPAFT